MQVKFCQEVEYLIILAMLNTSRVGFFLVVCLQKCVVKDTLLILLYKRVKYFVTTVFTDSTAEYGVEIHIFTC